MTDRTTEYIIAFLGFVLAGFSIYQNIKGDQNWALALAIGAAALFIIGLTVAWKRKPLADSAEAEQFEEPAEESFEEELFNEDNSAKELEESEAIDESAEEAEEKSEDEALGLEIEKKE